MIKTLSNFNFTTPADIAVFRVQDGIANFKYYLRVYLENSLVFTTEIEWGDYVMLESSGVPILSQGEI